MNRCENSKIQSFRDDEKMFPFVKNHFENAKQKGRKSFRKFPFSRKIRAKNLFVF
jgi:hypothetical protein